MKKFENKYQNFETAEQMMKKTGLEVENECHG